MPGGTASAVPGGGHVRLLPPHPDQRAIPRVHLQPHSQLSAGHCADPIPPGGQSTQVSSSELHETITEIGQTKTRIHRSTHLEWGAHIIHRRGSSLLCEAAEQLCGAQVPCAPPGDIVLAVSTVRPTAGGFLQLSIQQVEITLHRHIIGPIHAMLHRSCAHMLVPADV